MKKKRYIIGISAFILCIICFVAVYMIFSPKPSPKGQKAYILEVSDGNKKILLFKPLYAVMRKVTTEEYESV